MPKSNLYTRTGDKGTTSLVGGKRIEKDNDRLEAYGTIDELSSFLGAISADADCPQEQASQIERIQNLLFNIGAYLATEPGPDSPKQVAGLSEDDLRQMEGWIDDLDEKTPPINAFILPGGTPLSATTHIARAVCRRAERRIITLASKEYVDPLLVSYINRMSDYLFILARFFNFNSGRQEITWKP